MNLNDFFDISKPIQCVQVASGETDGRLCFDDDEDEDGIGAHNQEVSRTILLSN